jgi:flavin reductase (DIM6/NTAB) family NADH-FMN oxidoreductase RutF
MRQAIPAMAFSARAHYLWDKTWFLLTAGDFVAGHYNTMTVSWGSLGFLWERPFVQVVVRPHRYTFEFMERYDTFTLSAFPFAHHKALSLILGTKSGRDGDKIAEAGLTPMASTVVAAPCFSEAELVIECRKIYWADFDPAHFLGAGIEEHYPAKDYHRIYYGEILAIMGEEAYRRE